MHNLLFYTISLRPRFVLDRSLTGSRGTGLFMLAGVEKMGAHVSGTQILPITFG